MYDDIEFLSLPDGDEDGHVDRLHEEPKWAYARNREELVPGVSILHLSTGGSWHVERVNEDGSIFGRSDMRARRTVSAEHVDRALAESAHRFADHQSRTSAPKEA